MTAEGWYRDPFGIHTDRWFSDGLPTSLVRDGLVEGNDEPPAKTYDGELEDVPETPAVDGQDLLRAGESNADDRLQPANEVLTALDAGTIAAASD